MPAPRRSWEQLESELSFKSAAFRAHGEPPTLESVQKILTDDQAMVEFVRYRRFDPEDRERYWPEARCLAYVLQRHGPPRWVALGEAEPLERAVAALLSALAHPGEIFAESCVPSTSSSSRRSASW